MYHDNYLVDTIHFHLLKCDILFFMEWVYIIIYKLLFCATMGFSLDLNLFSLTTRECFK